MTRPIYTVYSLRNEKWAKVPFSEGTLAYCNGWVDCMDSLYPSNPHRIVSSNPMLRETRIVRETKGHGSVHTS